MRVGIRSASRAASIRLLTDANAQIVNRYDYDSYGRRLTAVEGVAQPYTWKAREYIAAIGMYYNRARFYDPQLGRFIAEDPLGYAGGSSNLYAFGWNNGEKVERSDRTRGK
jgi:RHS repeat-associated protein